MNQIKIRLQHYNKINKILILFKAIFILKYIQTNFICWLLQLCVEGTPAIHPNTCFYLRITSLENVEMPQKIKPNLNLLLTYA